MIDNVYLIERNYCSGSGRSIPTRFSDRKFGNFRQLTPNHAWYLSCKYTRGVSGGKKDHIITRTVPVSDSRQRTSRLKLCNHSIFVVFYSEGPVLISPLAENTKHSGHVEHGIASCDDIARCSFLFAHIMSFVDKKFSAPSILKAIHNNSLLRAVASLNVNNKDIHNCFQRVERQKGMCDVSLLDINSDINITLRSLRQAGYQCDLINVGSVLVFANENQLNALGRHGGLVSIDATHNTNKYGWKLSTLMV